MWALGEGSRDAIEFLTPTATHPGPGLKTKLCLVTFSFNLQTSLTSQQAFIESLGT
jgi:hypothetical protein